MSRVESSRRRYGTFVKAYRNRTLEDPADGEKKPKTGATVEDKAKAAGKRREYLRDYIKWLVAASLRDRRFLVLGLITAGLEMIEPLFMRFIIDRVLLNETLDRASRLSQLHVAALRCRRHRRRQHDAGVQGLPPEAVERQRDAAAAVAVRLHAAPAAGEALRHEDGRHPVLAADRRRRNDQRPAADGGRVAIALGGPSGDCRLRPDGAQLAPRAHRAGDDPRHHGDELGFTRRIRPIYRSVRKDAEVIDGRVGETFSGIRVVRAFAREFRELGEVHARPAYRAPQGAVRAPSRAAVWTSRGLLTSAGRRLVIVWYGGYLNVVGDATVGDIMAFQWDTFLLMNPVWKLANSFSERQRSLAAMERVFEVLDMENDKPNRPGALVAPATCTRFASRTWSSRIARASRSSATSTSPFPVARWSRSAAAAPARRP